MGKTRMPLNKQNYLFIIIGCAVVLLGFILMAGGGSEDPNVFNTDELFSFRRITLAPFLVMTGYGVVLYGILKRPKIEEFDAAEDTNEISDDKVIDTPIKE